LTSPSKASQPTPTFVRYHQSRRAEKTTNLLHKIEKVLHNIWILNSQVGHLLQVWQVEQCCPVEGNAMER